MSSATAISVALHSPVVRNHAKVLVAIMAGVSGNLLIECRMALDLTQEAFGDILGRTKRTVQRWEDRGTMLLPSEVVALAKALSWLRPDLAAQIASSADSTLDQLGIVPHAAVTTSAASDPIDSVVRAAAEAMSAAPDAIRPAVEAAFARAHELGLDVRTVVDRLSRHDTP